MARSLAARLRPARRPLPPDRRHPAPDRGAVPEPGLRDRHRARGRAGGLQLHQAEHPRVPPGPRRAGHVLPGGLRRHGAAHAHLADAGPLHARPPTAPQDHLPGQGVPQGRPRRHPLAVLPPGGGAAGGPRHPLLPPQGDAGGLLPLRSSGRISSCASAPATSPSPSRRPRSTSVASCAAPQDTLPKGG